ncbi:hypothetical protein FB451DRAFT_1290083 [Mycena latifolia]|nr:hypothetical protein FB451DRAFT_1290083 [Mycena latifolia]
MSFINYSAQEPRVYGRQHRQSVPTQRIQAHNEMQVQKENRRLAREAKASAKPKPRARSRTQPLNPRPQEPGSFASPHQLPSAPMQQSAAMQHSPANIFAPQADHGPQVPLQGLHLPARYDDPAFYAQPQLDDELEPRHAAHQGVPLDAAELDELERDPDADHAGRGDEEGSDDEGYTQAVSLDEGLRGLPQADNRITSTPADLSQSQPRRLVRRAVNATSPVISTPSPVVAYHTPTPTVPYATNPRQLVRRTHVFVPAANSPDPRSSPTPVPSKRPFSEVEDGHDEHDDSVDDEEDNDGAPVTVGRAADLNPTRRRIFDVGCRHIRMMAVSDAPFGDAIRVDKMAVGSWFAGLKDCQATHGYLGSTPPTHNEISLLKARIHQVKGDIKTVCRDAVVGKKGYDFHQDESPESIAHNRKLVTDLLTGNAFLYRDPMNRHIPGTLWEHPVLQEVLNRVFYNDEANSEAVLTPEYFANGLPLVTGACIANAVECVIMEYQTGRLVKSRMSAKTWQPKFEKHLKILQDWKVYTTNSGSHLTEKLQLRMIQDARKYAKVDITPSATEAIGISMTDFEKNDI